MQLDGYRGWRVLSNVSRDMGQSSPRVMLTSKGYIQWMDMNQARSHWPKTGVLDIGQVWLPTSMRSDIKSLRCQESTKHVCYSKKPKTSAACRCGQGRSPHNGTWPLTAENSCMWWIKETHFFTKFIWLHFGDAMILVFRWLKCRLARKRSRSSKRLISQKNAPWSGCRQAGNILRLS